MKVYALDYKKLVILALIILTGVGYRWISINRRQDRQRQADLFASVYAGTAVMAELYRKEPPRFLQARDSILSEYGIDSLWPADYQKKNLGREEEWSLIWETIQRKVDSLVQIYRSGDWRQPAAQSDSGQTSDAK